MTAAAGGGAGGGEDRGGGPAGHGAAARGHPAPGRHHQARHRQQGEGPYSGLDTLTIVSISSYLICYMFRSWTISPAARLTWLCVTELPT